MWQRRLPRLVWPLQQHGSQYHYGPKWPLRPPASHGLRRFQEPQISIQTLTVAGPQTQMWPSTAALGQVKPWPQLTGQVNHIGLAPAAAQPSDTNMVIHYNPDPGHHVDPSSNIGQGYYTGRSHTRDPDMVISSSLDQVVAIISGGCIDHPDCHSPHGRAALRHTNMAPGCSPDHGPHQ